MTKTVSLRSAVIAAVSTALIASACTVAADSTPAVSPTGPCDPNLEYMSYKDLHAFFTDLERECLENPNLPQRECDIYKMLIYEFEPGIDRE